MAKLRKMLGSVDAPYVIAMMDLIKTQSKKANTNWCVTYVLDRILPIYEKVFPQDQRLTDALIAAVQWQDGKVKIAQIKKLVAQVNVAAREAEGYPVAQAAARAASAAAGSVYTPTNALGFAFYAAAAVAYDEAGLNETSQVYYRIAQEEWGKMAQALKAISVQNEENPVNIDWNC